MQIIIIVYFSIFYQFIINTYKLIKIYIILQHSHDFFKNYTDRHSIVNQVLHLTPFKYNK